jgi:hypothetical protein
MIDVQLRGYVRAAVSSVKEELTKFFVSSSAIMPVVAGSYEASITTALIACLFLDRSEGIYCCVLLWVAPSKQY